MKQRGGDERQDSENARARQGGELVSLESMHGHRNTSCLLAERQMLVKLKASRR